MRRPNSNPDFRNGTSFRCWETLFTRVAALFIGAILLCAAHYGRTAEPVLPEYQVKALFLYNFVRYVNWPESTFWKTNAPFVIAVTGDDNLQKNLIKLVHGKSVDGHPILLKHINDDDPLQLCHMLFIGSSVKKQIVTILDKVKTLPILTVGESEEFIEQGGIINLKKNEGKVRLEINLDAARLAQLKLSSKLLSVADVVKGKH